MIVYSQYVRNHAQWDNAVAYAEKTRLNELAQEGEKRFLSLTTRGQQYLDEAQCIVDEIQQNYQRLVVIGMGGAILSGQALSTFAHGVGRSPVIEVDFIDNIDPVGFERLLESVDFAKTAFLAVSKSGETLETLSQVLALCGHFKSAISCNKAKNLYFITQDVSSSLGQLARFYQRDIIACDSDVGGRFSCFTPMALIPAGLCGVNLSAYLQSGREYVNSFATHAYNDCVHGAAFFYLCAQQGLNNHVLMTYMPALGDMNAWYSQLIAESWGKQQKGFTPIEAVGCRDQHSKLQLFLDGPKDKCYSFLCVDGCTQGMPITSLDSTKQLSILQGMTLSDVAYFHQQATVETVLSEHYGRSRHYASFSEQHLAAWMMQSMIETVLFAQMLEINPFDQQAVERIKSMANALMMEHEC